MHEIRYDGYRMHARIDGRDISCFDSEQGWIRRTATRRTIEALRSLKVKSAYLDDGDMRPGMLGVPVSVGLGGSWRTAAALTNLSSFSGIFVPGMA